MDGAWDDQAENWVRWARTPGFDAYWYYRDAFFDEIVPETSGRTLEIGCGEGRVARDLVERGHDVTALDAASTLVQHARAADPTGTYLVAGASRLPLRPDSFDLVVAYNVLQVVADLEGTVREFARMLRPGGHLCACVAHPVTDLGRWTGDASGAAFTLRPRYFESARVDETVERDGLRMTFRGWTHTLEDYVTAFGDAGLAIELVREPRPTGPGPFDRWSEQPLFLSIRAVRRARDPLGTG